MSASLRQTTLRAARATDLFRGMRWYHRDELLVLTYHSVVKGVRESRRRYPLVYRNAVDAPRFERQMRHLRRHYHLLDGEDLRAVLEGAPLPERAALVTFDDGLLNNATVALPILARLNVPAFFFLPTGFVDAASQGTLRRHWSEGLIAHLSHRSTTDSTLDLRAIAERVPTQVDLVGLDIAPAIRRIVDHLKRLPRSDRRDCLSALDALLGDPPSPSTFPADPEGHSVLATMTWEQARRATETSVTLGGHTVTHESLARLPDDTAASEIRDCLHAISEKTGQTADFFSYPYGRPQDFSTVHREVLSDLGCRGAFTQIVGFNDASTDPMTLRRIDVSPNYSLDMFCYVASGTKRAVDRLVRGRSPSSP